MAATTITQVHTRPATIIIVATIRTDQTATAKIIIQATQGRANLASIG